MKDDRSAVSRQHHPILGSATQSRGRQLQDRDCPLPLAHGEERQAAGRTRPCTRRTRYLSTQQAGGRCHLGSEKQTPGEPGGLNKELLPNVPLCCQQPMAMVRAVYLGLHHPPVVGTLPSEPLCSHLYNHGRVFLLGRIHGKSR